MKTIKTLTIIIPLYNEERRILKTFPKIKNKVAEVYKNLKTRTDVIFVNDGSTDKTIKTLKKLIGTDKNMKLVSYKNNRGKGYALKQGFKHANGEFIIFMDADLSTPLSHLEEFIENIKDDKTILIGSRKTKGANVTEHQPWIREKLGQGFTLISNIFILWGISDFTCGFKMFPNRAGKKIFSKVTIDRWGYDSEVLFLANKYGYKIKEIPVEWKNSGDTKVDLKKDILGSLGDIVDIRKNNFTGSYE